MSAETPSNRVWRALWAIPVALWGLVQSVAAYMVTERVSFLDMFMLFWLLKAIDDAEWGLAAGILVGGAVLNVILKGVGRVRD